MIDIALDTLMSSTFWAIFVPLLSAVLAWSMNELSKRKWENYKRREERYINLVNYLDGFYQDTDHKQKKHLFINELRLCWLYAPDGVIQAANKFLITCRNETEASQEEQDVSIGNLILEIRKDLKSTKTELLAKDFLHWSVG